MNADAFQIYPGCTAPPTAPQGATYYADPVHGSPDGDGSAAKPWNSLQAIFSKTASYAKHPNWLTPACKALSPSSNIYSRCLTGPMLSNVSYYHDDGAGNWTTNMNPNAPIHSGDTVLLMTGNYGDITITDVVNPEFITITTRSVPGLKQCDAYGLDKISL